jgi:hypothetical protein
LRGKISEINEKTGGNQPFYLFRCGGGATVNKKQNNQHRSALHCGFLTDARIRRGGKNKEGA